MRFASTLPFIVALVVGSTSVRANDSADYTSLYAREGDLDSRSYQSDYVENYVRGYDFEDWEGLSARGMPANHRRQRVKKTTPPNMPPAGFDPVAQSVLGYHPTPHSGAPSTSVSSDSELASTKEPRELEDLEARKKHKKQKKQGKKHGKKHGKKNKKHGKKHNKKGKKHGKKHGGKKHNKKHGGKKHNKKHNKKHHKRDEMVDGGALPVARAYYDTELDARMFDELVERYDVAGDSLLEARDFFDTTEIDSRDLGDFLWD